MTWLSTTRTTMSMAASRCGRVQADVVRRDPLGHDLLRRREQRLARAWSAAAAARCRRRGSRRRRRAAAGCPGRSSSTARTPPPDRGDQVVGCSSKAAVTTAEEPVELAQDHRLGQRAAWSRPRCRPSAGSPRPVGEPRHRDRGPADVGGQHDGGVDDPLAHASGPRAASRVHAVITSPASRSVSVAAARSRPSRGRRSRGSTRRRGCRPTPCRPRSPRARRRRRPRRCSRSRGSGPPAPRP